jgi:hypothetical protein
MALPNIFTLEETNKIIERINNLNNLTQPVWGKMNVAQMLAHVCVSYEMVYENKHKVPGAFLKFILKTFIKKSIVGEGPYKKNSQTAPAFLITNERDFNTEKQRIIDYLKKTQELGENYFEDRESLSFGKLSKKEWNNLFWKHIDHHLKQFGV